MLGGMFSLPPPMWSQNPCVVALISLYHNSWTGYWSPQRDHRAQWISSICQAHTGSSINIWVSEWMGKWMNVWINDFVPIHTWDGAKCCSPSPSEWSWMGTAVLRAVGRGEGGFVLPSDSQEEGPSPLRFAACSAQVSFWGEMSLTSTQNTSPYSPSLSIFSLNFCSSLLWWSSNSSSWALRMRKHSDLINTRDVCRHTDK